MRLSLLLLAAALLIAGPGRAYAACSVDPDLEDGVGSGCVRCSADGARCEECGERYGLKKDGTCVTCQPVLVGKLLEEKAPVRCYPATTVSKAGGFPALYPNAKGECEYCPTPGCNQCLPGNGTCVQCKVNHGAAPAEAGGVTCVECSTDLPALMCRTCDAKDTKKCLECRTSGEFLKDNQCVECSSVGIENCDECPDGKTCKTCGYGFALDASGKCVACPENCDDCSEPGKCSSCTGGFGPDGKGGCTACKIDPCTNCTTSLDTCEPLGCEFGFYFDAEKKACTPCAEGCNYCLGAPDNCYGSCDDGYGLVVKPDSKAACERCTLDNCTECNGDLAKCNKCNTTYFVDSATGACAKCGEGCADCESPTTCNACSTGLGLVDGKCQKCQLENCASCDEGLATCDFCADPYYLSDATKKCEQARLNRLFDLLSRQTTL
ncbi:hypothetical protein COHA_000747 [Chlorella ohadii]|uniref:Uncharacterized protein n=1 Tax=Chlorella ohadii TaxID=2649997 RepID=A0AAD5DWP6_9CHLO|nr:hypothetical protein COHA_000747 [Chlorella ohadii]